MTNPSLSWPTEAMCKRCGLPDITWPEVVDILRDEANDMQRDVMADPKYHCTCDPVTRQGDLFIQGREH